jgi:hypothetical protein
MWRYSRTITTYLDETIYLTEVGWSYTLLYYLFVIQRHAIGRFYNQRTYGKMLQILYQTSLSLELTITALFWCCVYDPSISAEGFIDTIIAHVVAFIILFLELPLNSYEFAPRQAIFILLTGIIYLTINVVYTLKVKIIYDVLNWKDLFSIIFAVSAFLLAFLMFGFGRLLFNKWKKGRVGISTFVKIDEAIL